MKSKNESNDKDKGIVMSDRAIIEELTILINNENENEKLFYQLNDDDNVIYLEIRNTELSNEITDKLVQLAQVLDLTISSCNADNWLFLEKSTSLVKLRLSNVKKFNSINLQKLSKLNELDLFSIDLENLGFLSSLQQLEKLYLSDIIIINLDDNETVIETFSIIATLTNLTTLSMIDCHLNNASFLSNLTQLKDVNLASNNITNIDVLMGFNNLKDLWLHNNKISDFSVLESLAHPEKITHLSLGRNDNLSDISFLSDYKNIVRLHLQENKIKDISSLKCLTKLSELNVEGNLISDISCLEHLDKLTVVQLQSNPIIELPTWITQRSMEVQWDEYGFEENTISFFDNPLVSPPPEIVKQGNEAIDDYFNSISGKPTAKLNEIKVLLVGEGMAGKTSILKRFQNMPFDEKESQTHGINVATVKMGAIDDLAVNDELEHCRLHFWDFGGQEIMHASHQFFMSKRALYILVLDSRTDSKKYYWLKHIEKLGGNSPIILIMNKMDANPNYNIEQQTLNEKFPNLKNRFFKVSCKDDDGIAALLECLPKAVQETDLFNSTISMNWMRVKQALESQTSKDNYLDHRAFLDICEVNDVTKPSEQKTLLQYLHDLGVVLHFEKLDLSNIFVLDPHWVTIGVYKIINSAQIKQGVLSIADLDFILNREEIKQHEYDPAKDKQITYSNSEQSYLVSIMELFELCYPLTMGKDTYIIPDLLPKELAAEPDLSCHCPLRFMLTYDFLPSAIIARLMLRLKEDIDQGQQWKFGMVLFNKELNCRAKIKSNEDTRTIDILIAGDQFQKQKYFAVIKHALSEINSGFTNLQIDESIPLLEYSDVLVDYQEILNLEKMGETHYISGKLAKKFVVSDLLDCYSSKDLRHKHNKDAEHNMQKGNFNVNVHLDNVGNPTISQNQTNTQSSQQHAELTATQEQSVAIDIKNIQGLLKNLKDDVLEEVELEIDDDKEKRRINNEFTKIETAFNEMSDAQQQETKELTPSTFERLTDFVDNLQDEDSRINKALGLLTKGKDKAQKLATTYNKIAPYFALPVVPDVFLNK